MPRAVDRYQIQADFDPTRSGTEFHIANLIQSEGEILAALLGQWLEMSVESIIDFIKNLTGIDLTNWASFLDGLAPQLGLDDLAAWIGQIVAVLNGISLTEGGVLSAISDAITNLLDGLLEWIETTTGIDLTSFTTLLGGLSDFLSIEDIGGFFQGVQSALSGISLTSGGVLSAITDAIAGLLDGLLEWIETTTGIDLTSFTTLLGGLSDFLSIEDIGGFFQGVQSALSGISLTAGGIIGAITDAVEGIPLIGEFAEFLEQLVTGGLNINVLNLFGQLAPGLFSLIPISALGDTTPNLLVAPTFSSGAVISGDENWVFDGSVGRNSLGSLKALANGTNLAIRANKIAVTSGQKLNASTWVKWSGLTATGSAIQMQMVAYADASSETGVPATVAEITSPASSGEWVQLDGVYTVPTGVNFVTMRLLITNSASTGSVWFDDCDVHTTGLLAKNLVEGLVDDLAEIVGRIQDVIDAIVGEAGAAVEDIVEGIRNIVSTVFSELMSILTLGGTLPNPLNPLEELAGWLGLTRDTADRADDVALTTQAEVVSLQTIFSFKSSRPLWDGLDGSGESTIPLALAQTTFDVTDSSARGGFVRCDGGDEKKSITFAGYTTGTVSSLYLDLYKLNEDGSVTLVHSSSDMSGDLQTAPAMYKYDLPEGVGFLTELGDIYGVQIRIEGSGTFKISGASMPNIAPLIGFRPKHPGFVRATGTPAPATIDTGTMDALYTTSVPYLQLGSITGVVPRSLYDPFNNRSAAWVWRNHQTQFGPDLFMGDIQISGGKASYGGLVDGYEGGIYPIPVATGRSRVGIRISGSLTSKTTCATVCSNNSWSNYAMLAVSSGSVAIKTGSALQTSTTRASTSAATASGDWFWMAFDPDDDTFRVYRNPVWSASPTPILSWEDANGIVSQGGGNRFGGIRLDRSLFVESAPIGDFILEDW